MVPEWVRNGFIVGWFLVLAGLVWRLGFFGIILVVIVAVLVFFYVLVMSALIMFDTEYPRRRDMPLPSVSALWVLLLLPMLPLAFALYLFYQVSIVSIVALLLWWLLPHLLRSQGRRYRVGWATLVVLVLVWGAFYGYARFNFALTAAARQRVVDRVVQLQTASLDGTVVTDMSVLERVFLGRATAYQDETTVAVYFDSYKGRLDAAFIVYTRRPQGEDFGGGKMVRLAQDWVFFHRGYAN